MKNLPLLIGTIVGTVILIVVIATMSSGSQTTSQGQQIVDQSLAMGDARHTFKVESEAMGQEEVPDSESIMMDSEPNQEESTNSADVVEQQELITIVEFSDFQCPACKASLPAVEAVKSVYPGQVQVIYRHFPLDSIHPNARLAAIASEAVASLDETAFWPFHDRLFLEQQAWSDISSRSELKNTFAAYAADLGLDTKQFLEKMEDSSVTDLVNQDVAAATQLGINSTPTFYVNGVKTTASGLMGTVESLVLE